LKVEEEWKAETLGKLLLLRGEKTRLKGSRRLS
jgi:hypothetical protein